MRYAGKKVAIIVDTGTHDHEFWYPYYRFQEEGAKVLVAGRVKGELRGEGINGKDGLLMPVSHTVDELAGEDLDLLFLPGGIYAPLALRMHGPTIGLVKRMVAESKPVCAICHAPWILISAGVVAGRAIACPGDIAIDVRNAGGTPTQEPAVMDGGVLTSVYFAYLPQMFALLNRHWPNPQP
jgi:protease I